MGLLDALLATGPSLLWPMNHASGAALDVSGNGRHATNFGTTTPQYAQVIPAAANGMRTAYGAATVSNGNGIAAASVPSVAAGQAMTYAMWGVLNATPASAPMILGRRKSASVSGGMLYLASDRSATFYILSSGTNPENYLGLQTSAGVNWLWSLNALTMIAVTVDASNVAKAYVDGSQMGFDFYSDSATHVGYVTSATLAWRNNGGDDFMAGGGSADTFGSPDMTYGPVGVWNRALTANEIDALHAESVRGGVLLGMGGYGG